MPDTRSDLISDRELEDAFGPREELGVAEQRLMASIIRQMTGVDSEPVTIGPYELGEVLGEGAMGVVYRSHDSDLDVEVAVKVLRRRGALLDPEVRRRALREAKAMAEVIHRNVVHVHKVGFDRGQAWISMELVPGKTLRNWLHDDEHSWEEVLRVYVQAGRGLAVAHARNVIHGDFKPDNVLIGDDGVPKVADFGLALLGGEHSPAGGTPEYMAPEQYLGRHRDARSDQFSFCVALFEGLTAHHPYSRWTFGEFLSTIQARDPTATQTSVRQEYRRLIFVKASHGELSWPRVRDGIPRSIRVALTRGLDPDPERRFSTMGELVDRLDLERQRKRTRIFIGAAAALAVAAMAGGVGMYQYQRRQRAEICRAAPDEYAKVWNDEVRSSLVPRLGDPTTNRVEELVEIHRARWQTAYANACEATLMEREADAWISVEGCLNRRLLAVDAGLTELAEEGSTDAVTTVDELTTPSPALCWLDAASLTSARALDARDTDAIAEVRAELALARIDEIARRYDDGITRVEPQLSRAKALDYEPLLAEVHYQLGRLRLQRSRNDSAQREGWNTPGFDDLAAAATYASNSFHRSTAWDIAIFQAKMLSVLGRPVPPVDLESALDHEPGGRLLLREQEAELLEMHGLDLYRRGLEDEEPDEAVDLLREAVASLERAAALQAKRGHRLGRAKALGNLARTQIELGTRLGGEQAAASYRGAAAAIEEAMKLWGEESYGHKYLAPLNGQLVNALMTIDSTEAREIVESALAELGDDPDSIYVLLPGLQAFLRQPFALELADRAMALLDNHPLPPLIESQLRMYALDALIRDPAATSRLGDVRQWSAALEHSLPLDPRLSAREPLAQAFLGRAKLLLGQWSDARSWLQKATSHQSWSTMTDVTRAEVWLDLAETELHLDEREPAAEALARAWALIDGGTEGYPHDVLAPRHEALLAELREI